MSQSEDEFFRRVSQLESRLRQHGAELTGQVTPHALLQCLKEPCDDTEYTELGALIRASLRDDTRLELLRWVTFHFDLPASLFGNDETATRNWIAIRHREQALVDSMHQDSVGRGTEHISSIYAPSVIIPKLVAIASPFTDLCRREYWLYRISSQVPRSNTDAHALCASKLSSPANMLCFGFDSDGRVAIRSCFPDKSASHPDTLGELLREDERTASERFETFARIVRLRTAQVTSSSEPPVHVACNFYTRAPVFFSLSEEVAYMTEVYAAFHSPSEDSAEVVQLWQELVPLLRLIISVVSSPVAYLFASVAQEASFDRAMKEVALALAQTIAHDMRGSIEHVLDDLETIADGGKPISAAMVRSIEGRLNFIPIPIYGLEGLFTGEKEPLSSMLDQIDKQVNKWDDFEMTIPSVPVDVMFPRAFRFVLSELVRNSYRNSKKPRGARKKTAEILLVTTQDGYSLTVQNPVRKKGAKATASALNTIESFNPTEPVRNKMRQGIPLLKYILQKLSGTITFRYDSGKACLCADVTLPKEAYQ